MFDDNVIHFEMCDLEGNFEPLTRTRSNTWPMPEPHGYVDRPLIDGVTVTRSNESMKINIKTPNNHVTQITEFPSIKKKSSRQNAWGNLSYAELITLAISSVKDQRLTLSQIYGWMVNNVPFFKDKGDNNSSAGWKNSVRHNLSLHNRFIRVPNEGVGKSSWWMINPNAKLEKSTRRRATSMEVGKYERKQAKARRNVEIIKKENFHKNSISLLNYRNHNSIDSYFVNSISNARKLKSLSFCSRPLSCSCSNKLSPTPVHSDEPKWTSKYNYTLKHAPASQIKTTHPILIQQVEPTPIQHNDQSDLSSISYQINDSASVSRNVQSIPIACTLTQLKEPCALHHQVFCTCNINIIQLASSLPTNQTESYVVLEDEKPNQFLLDRYTHQSNVNSTQSSFNLIEEKSSNNSYDLQFDNNLQNKIINAPLIRNNSLLDDIDEIIKREQCSSVDNVNDSIY